MPAKYKKTEKKIDRQTKKVSIVHEYIKCKSIQELIDAYNKRGLNLNYDKKLRTRLFVETN